MVYTIFICFLFSFLLLQGDDDDICLEEIEKMLSSSKEIKENENDYRILAFLSFLFL